MLRAIHDLDIQDKHQSLIPQVLAFASPAFRIEDDGAITIVDDPNAATDMRLTFPQNSAFDGRELIPTLHDCVELVAGVIAAFRDLPENS